MHHEPIERGLAFLPSLFPSFVPADYLFREALEREDEQIQFWQRSLLTEHDQFVFSFFSIWFCLHSSLVSFGCMRGQLVFLHSSEATVILLIA